MGPRPNGTRIRDGDMGEKERNNHDPEEDGDQLDQAATDEDDQVASVTTHPALASPGPFWECAPHRFATAPGSELVLGPVRSSPTACRNVERGINLRSDCPSPSTGERAQPPSPINDSGREGKVLNTSTRLGSRRFSCTNGSSGKTWSGSRPNAWWRTSMRWPAS